MKARLISVPGSHPCVGVELMLRHKGIPFTRLDLPNMTHRAIMPLLGFRHMTVPGLILDGKRVQTSMRIARALEVVRPEPPLFGDDSIESAEAWADSVLQDGVRQLARYAVGEDEEAMASFLDGPLLGVPVGLVKKAIPVLRPVVSRQMRPRRGTAEACLAALPAQLDRVDALLAEGVIGGPQPNAADFQIAPSVRLMLTFDQLREPILDRPAGRHAMALVPDYPGRFRQVFPAAWLPFE